ncbi:MAG: RNA ligase family protein [Planctomycetaceae bacterium]|nr:RNA ligase family protein [Planctomycetaceae bacterium]
MFVKYQHIEKLGTAETDGILDGMVYIFPKLDGANGSIWYEDGQIRFGSRNHYLGENNDNHGFKATMHNCKALEAFFADYPHLRLYGEWLVPHTLKTYCQEAWHTFWVFDVTRPATGIEGDYLPYDEYMPILNTYGIDLIPALAVIKNPTPEQAARLLDSNTFLIQDGRGIGKGIVLKNYQYSNRYGRRTWAKIVTNDFKAKALIAMGTPLLNSKTAIEDAIANDFLDVSLIEKVKANIHVTHGWTNQQIPQLLGRVWHDFVTEEIWEILRKLKNPTIDFRTLNRALTKRIKELKPEIFTNDAGTSNGTSCAA